MSLAEHHTSSASAPSGITARAATAAEAARAYLAAAREVVSARVAPGGKVDAALLEREQVAAHGLAWTATYVETLTQLADYLARMESQGTLTAMEEALAGLAIGEYVAELTGGLPMSQGEILRPADMGVAQDAVDALTDATAGLFTEAASAEARVALARMIEADSSGFYGNAGLDETLDLVRSQFRRFADDKVTPFAHQWHLKDDLIPLEVIREMSELGVFGLTIPENAGGLGMGKIAMCVVSEELSRGYIGVGSLGTRSEIAAELIMAGGTEEQKARLLPKIASGEILPTAVFTEPNTGSDLASLRTRAMKSGDSYVITGNKTWITHAARADMMTLLARSNPDAPGYKGLSMFLVEKPRGTDAEPFPLEGMSGGEIGVLGYRGMKEYEIGFDGVEVPASALLGGEEGRGFKQLMATFESARIQTAARAVGVAQAALDLGLAYATERQQFGKALINFPRVAGKLAMMAAEILAARQLTYFAAREKDQGHRCDLEAGMAKLLGARVAWAAADNALQIHGGNGFALEYPVSRVLCDARILNIFEGAAEIQAQVIARRLLES
ncbi:acyl-CoA dehydrogenase [Pyruvatibacter mobilis]|uniref:Acyl-CoA dehydrogenase n=1 Tax=Pyruvatibacter mobilis TaxID=1712261 RepID=A0A845Q7A2_9HYPH|nr:acyl-CoA dehydrogenase family protein [Pyruvatibacter mobilis]NBG94462.1 acyl-CoA dehydrogenase [Pyruvatibacter mobilis]QJD73986.1 acyl-CoA dehydrogenase [Pyruvatibacter mobilis]GGD03142.1 (2S)-methylsuccinyl-CoA dehydrogenase [Pyruvatibacter mobilis]